MRLSSRHIAPAPHLCFIFLLWVLPPEGCLSFPLRTRRANRSRQRQHPTSTLFAHDLERRGDPTDQPVRFRRRRRRRKDSVIIPINKRNGSDTIKIDYKNNQGGSDTDTREEPAELTVQSQCPIFSVTFPTYRINLSSSFKSDESEQRRMRRVQRGIITKLVKSNSSDKASNSNEKGKNGTPWDALGGIFKGVFKSGGNEQRARVESLYSKEVKQGLLRWIPSSLGDEEASPYLDEDLRAMAAFWRMSADITSPHTLSRQQSQQQQWYLALPGTTPTVAQNLCDILTWYANLLEERASKDDVGHIKVYAELDSRSDAIPVVRFTVTTNLQQYHRERQQQQKKLLPTAEQTEVQTKAWVKRLLVQLGICPFTKSEIKSGQGLGDMGVPVANILYRHSDALSEGCGVYLLMADAWDAINDMIAAGSSGKNGASSILLSAPGFDDDFELWAGPVFSMLETCVGAIQAEEMIGVVCFHCNYVTPDGKSWPGFGHMHSLPRLKQWYNQHSSPSSSQPAAPLSDNEIAAGGAWQRRTPHAVINVLRAEQLEAAEGRRKTGELYERNLRVLMSKDEGIGLEKLAEDLKREQCL